MDIKRLKAIEAKWLARWQFESDTRQGMDKQKPKFYCLDMFPYPSGSGLHVGHPRGYIATDVYARFKRMHGFHVMHPMGFDAFGLPAEQYAIETGQHPKVTTTHNIDQFKSQLKKLGLCHDAAREIRTCDPRYYQWTQWIFCQLFDSWYCVKTLRAQPIAELVRHFEKNGNLAVHAHSTMDTPRLSADQWNTLSNKQKSDVLMNYRLAYRANTTVNWCPALGTVLANDEIKNGLSERGGHSVVRKTIPQWMLRITAYSERLLQGLGALDWPESIKTIQRNWIGKSAGALIDFEIVDKPTRLKVFTSDPDTLSITTYLVLNTEHELIELITLPEYKKDVSDYCNSFFLKIRSQRNKTDSGNFGQFTGAYAKHPLTGAHLPIYVSESVSSDEGTGVKMGRQVLSAEALESASVAHVVPQQSIRGKGTFSAHTDPQRAEPARVSCNFPSMICYRMRDAIFGRQRYWGEPIPIYYDHDLVPVALPIDELPLTLPDITHFLPTPEGLAPLERAQNWRHEKGHYETTTMPGWAASSWYFLRYMDARNSAEPVSKIASDYWQSVDLYIGGAEHATGHLLYARFWTMFLHDIQVVNFEEPFQKLVCQGMILGLSAVIYRDIRTGEFVSADLIAGREIQSLYVDISLVDKDNTVDLKSLRRWRSLFEDATFICTNDRFFCERTTEKMSKSKYNTVTPDTLIDQYGADAFRLHEMFLSPLQQTVLWGSDSIDGPYRFLQKVWRLFFDAEDRPHTFERHATLEQSRWIHSTVAKVSADTEKLSYNTAIAALMTCVNHLTRLQCRDRGTLQSLVKILHPYAPFITAEIWSEALGEKTPIADSAYPAVRDTLPCDAEFNCPVSINGKVRTHLKIRKDLSEEEVRIKVLSNPDVQRWLAGSTPRRFIFIPHRLVNLVC